MTTHSPIFSTDWNARLKKAVLWLVLLITPVVVTPFHLQGNSFLTALTADTYSFPKALVIYLAAFILASLYIVERLAKLKKNPAQPQTKARLDGIDKTALFLGLWMTLSSLLAPSLSGALWGEPGRFDGLFYYLAVLILFSAARRVPLGTQKPIGVMFLICAFLSAVGIWEYYGGRGLLFDMTKNHLPYFAASFMGNPNFFGSYLVLLWPAGLYLLLSCPRSKLPLWMGANTVVFYAVLCTRTRSAWLGIGMVMAWVIAYSFKKRAGRRLLLLGVLLLPACGLFLATDPAVPSLGPITYRLQSIVGEIIPSLRPPGWQYGTGGSRRLFIWTRTASIISDHPLTGVGFGGYREEFMKRYKKDIQAEFDDPETAVDKAHNEYLQIGAVNGIPALFSYLLWLLLILWKGLKKFWIYFSSKKSAQIEVYPFLFAAVCGYLVQAFFNISVVSVSYLFYIFLGIMASGWALPKNMLDGDGKKD